MLMRDSMGNDRKDAPIGKQIKPRHRPEAVPAETPACPIFVWEVYAQDGEWTPQKLEDGDAEVTIVYIT